MREGLSKAAMLSIYMITELTVKCFEIRLREKSSLRKRLMKNEMVRSSTNVFQFCTKKNKPTFQFINFKKEYSVISGNEQIKNSVQCLLIV
jgi:hypothetical protein